LAFATGTRNLPLNIESMTTSEIILILPKGVSGRGYTFTITNPMGVIKSIGFSQHSTGTPTVNMISTATIPSNTQT